ncbi:hypothetical protein J2Z48_002092 [Croceifilum oryzae]|uniref:Uncharacterized protein n=1 Tax=Croceifilum oryzae TaxID=1553429 RepID=A0AAJ1WSZ5_9BACL|nr:hypothetical protein [Croceifilum oryzae]MDQ0417908.1 hypothetical protein [Croceifilum oryzae]
MRKLIVSELFFPECTCYRELAKAIHSGRFEGYIFTDLTIVHSKETESRMFILRSGKPVAVFTAKIIHINGNPTLIMKDLRSLL